MMEEKQVTLSFQKIVSDFKHILVMFFLMAPMCLIISTIAVFYPDALKVLQVSSSTPWGIVTSLFANRNMNASFSNLGAFLFYLILFVLGNLFLSPNERRRRSLYLSLSTFLGAIIANTYWLLHYPQAPALGTSSIVYGLEGAVLVFSIANLFFVRQLTWYAEKIKKKLAISWAFNLILALIISTHITYELLNYTALLAAKVNVLVHWISFWGCACLTLFWFLIRSLKLFRKPSMV